MTKTCYHLISVFLNLSPICKSVKIFKKRWSRDTSLDLTTQYLYVTCTSTIIQLIPPPPPLKFCITLSISPGYFTAVPREIENNVYAKFWGANKVHYRRWASGVYIQMLRTIRFFYVCQISIQFHPPCRRHSQ